MNRRNEPSLSWWTIAAIGAALLFAVVTQLWGATPRPPTITQKVDQLIARIDRFERTVEATTRPAGATWYYDATCAGYRNPGLPGYGDGARALAAMPHVRPCRFVYAGTIDTTDREAVQGLARQWAIQEPGTPVIYDDESRGPFNLGTPAGEIDGQIRKHVDFMDWWREADPRTQLGDWMVAPFPLGQADHSQLPVYREKARSLTRRIDFAVVCLYGDTPKVFDEQVMGYLARRHENPEVASWWVAIKPVTDASQPLPAAEFERQCRVALALRPAGLVVWCGLQDVNQVGAANLETVRRLSAER